MNNIIDVVILAAGAGTRMHTSTPKLLQQLADKYILQHVLEAAQHCLIQLTPKKAKIIIVYGCYGTQIQAAIADKFQNQYELIWVQQFEQHGTANAVSVALPYLYSDDTARCLVLCGDVPLIRAQTLVNMFSVAPVASIILLTAIVNNPTGYGRILRTVNNDTVSMIIEEADLQTIEQRGITEINSGIYLFNSKFLQKNVVNITNNNSQHEFYLTDLISIAHIQADNDNQEHSAVSASPSNYPIHTIIVNDVREIQGINDLCQLAIAERAYHILAAECCMRNGLRIVDSTRIELRGKLLYGNNCMIDINCIFSGIVQLGNNIVIGAGCIISNSTIAENAIIKPYSIIENSSISAGASVGPYSRLRPGSSLAANVRVGNFVEIKNSNIGTNSKINHLSYIGDADIGSNVNIGAGVITANYDGKNKHHTVISDDSSVGANAVLVAPVKIGNNVKIGAGSVITKPVSDNTLAVARAKQINFIKK